MRRELEKTTSCNPLFLLHLLLLLPLPWPTAAPAPVPNITKPGCRPNCGNVSITYPFGIGHGCHLQERWFNLTCDDTHHPPRLLVGNFNQPEVLDISLQGQMSVNVRYAVSLACYNKSGEERSFGGKVTLLEDAPFTLSGTRNKLIAIGCDTEGVTRTYWDNKFMTATGCLSVCLEPWMVVDNSCSGIGCCQSSIPPGIRSISVYVNSFNNHSQVLDFNPCSFAFVVDKDRFNFAVSDLLAHSRYRNIEEVKIPVVLDWTIGNQTCAEAQKNEETFACKSENSVCSDSSGRSRHSGYGYGYRCSCRGGYKGNPYLDGGCQDIDECTEKKDICGQKKCVNQEGSYTCKPKFNKMRAILGASLCLSCVFIVCSWMYWGLQKRKLIKLKEKYFRKNGGLLLQQQIKTHGVAVATKIFSAEELEKATNKYHEARIIGRGGYGIVYKGILADSKVVAIKKSKIVDESQIEQFINEVFILSQINHRNVVKLLGCCLETEVPLLVYEFIFNGTLSSHIHDEERRSSLSLDDRLRIASETAGALAYLHSAALIPIFHRDVKSTNILLDDNQTAKVSDFGASRLVPVDKTRITTLVQGTIGYLDPEYFHTGQLSEKSDVYSFGVVLVELLTGEKPNSVRKSGEDLNLAMYFISAMKKNCLFQVLENRVVNEGDVEQLLAISQLAKRCLSLRGEGRPTMKDVALELERLRKFTGHPHIEGEDEDILSEVGEQLGSFSCDLEEDNLANTTM